MVRFATPRSRSPGEPAQPQLGHDFGLRPASGLALGAVLCMVPRPCAGIPARSIAATALDDIPARLPPIGRCP